MANIDVDRVRFSPVRLREGYDMGEVDQHLDLVKQTLAALDAAVTGSAPVPGALPSPRFTPVRLREGYDMGEVDAFLDEVAAEEARLRGLAGRGIAVPDAPQTDPVIDPSAPDRVTDVSAPAEVVDVSAPPTGDAAYPELIREGSSGTGLAVVALVVLVALVLALVLL
ncbi:DivIVA domain-containing protein [Nocardioides jiangxiensis]|uniref:DivIVA domain-containing protein n=1 Tax=Nocardioides jiangxiensis TaxID=3064524 RepID=A0ABT9B6Y3_9ACTN|nr:DivIVA domain-containing protein [Nocardioides sp. WY-20]MDO7868893.1 DivIVA domain-containing protein [Nocardioides sp. WY-20]